MTVPRIASGMRCDFIVPRAGFFMVNCGDDVCALMLEVIQNHDWSRFLRGATIAAWGMK